MKHRSRTSISSSLAVLSLVAGALALQVGSASADDGAVRVGTAKKAVQDSEGATWTADTGFTGGIRQTPVAATRAISGTTDPALYRTEHYGMSSFAQAVSPGTYDVTLRAAELYFSAPGQRVFNVTAEGSTVLSNVDIYAAVGKFAAYDRTFRTTVTDGELDLGFTASANYAKVSAIEIVKVPTPPAPGTVRPDATNTGVPAGTVLTPYYGNLTITTPGATYDAMDIHGFVTIKAPNVHITRSIIRGGVATTAVGIVTNYDPTATNFILEDSELVPEHPSVYLDAIKGGNYTARRVNMHSTTDSVKIHGDNVTVESSWLHDNVDWASDPYQGGKPSHNDGVQILSGHNISIVGNSISGSSNSAMQVTQDNGVVSGVTFSQNWASDGWCSVNIANKPLPSMTGITVSGNRFGADTRTDCAVISSQATTLLAAGNVWQDTGLPARVRNGG